MSYQWTKRQVTVEANTLYDGTKLRASNVNVTLPAIEHTTVDMPGAMGQISIPLTMLLEDLEMTVDFNGEPENMVKLCIPRSHKLTTRWVGTLLTGEGAQKVLPMRAETSCMPVDSLPEISTELGEDIEQELTFKVWEYSLFRNNKQLLYVNRFTHTLKMWNGKTLEDYSTDYSKYL